MTYEGNSTEPNDINRPVNYVRSELAILFANEPELAAGFDKFLEESKERREDMSNSPLVQVGEKVKERFKNDPEKLEAYNAPFKDLAKQLLSDTPPQNVQDLLEDAFEKTKAVLAGEPDLLEMFEADYQSQRVNWPAKSASSQLEKGEDVVGTAEKTS
jgi:histone deacetylase complex regulatory component SIN3